MPTERRARTRTQIHPSAMIRSRPGGQTGSGRRSKGDQAMDYVNLGATGLRVSRICLGMMSYGKHETRQWAALEEHEAEPIVRRAVEGGITFFDTADVYNGGQSEVITGRLLPKLFGLREEYVVATNRRRHQTQPPGGRAGRLAPGVERSRDRTPRGAIRPAPDRRPPVDADGILGSCGVSSLGRRP